MQRHTRGKYNVEVLLLLKFVSLSLSWLLILVDLGGLGRSYRKAVLTVVISYPTNLGVGEVSFLRGVPL